MTCSVVVPVGEAWSQEVEAETGTQEQQSNNAAAPATFDMLELRVKGNSLLDKKQLERTVYPFLGPKKSIDNVESARSALEELYRNQGYQTVSVDIPEQDVKNGVVYLQVVEGKVSRLRVKDSRYFSLGKIKAGVPELAEGNVPNLPKMQKQLAELAGESTDRQIVPVLRAGETPGTLEVDLKVKDELPLHGKVELNGRNTATTSRLRLVSSLRYDNLWQQMHSASLMYQVSPENNEEVDVWAGTYAMPLFDDGTRLAVYGVGSSSTSQIASAGALSVIGIGNIYGARLVKPLKPLTNYFHSATLGVDYKDFQEDLALIGSDSLKTPITYLPFTAQYSGTAKNAESMTTFDLGMHFSVRGLGNDQTEFENKRYKAKANYIYLTGDLKHQHNLPLGMELVGRFSGQVADTPLISNEQFSLGGAQSVRGYFETQSLADDGVFGSLELYSPHLGMTDWDYLDQLKVLAFFDAAKGWIKEALPGNSKGDFLSSAGVGLHFQLWKHLSGGLDVGFPFTSLEPVKSGDPKVHFNIATEF
ncbi:ShlB/FhaC/HecB family hemolysin secretion/activation protein [Methylomonas sp. LL1]|uniref:ShlB/FhaC/HecB family hemolysin secretion/activation protein n=1 Tax=Methylomonas sp. LL1 TaxID=2785785 RepID=UPI001E573FAA|nr:POTRA domain-containing protein [Methylomonas sp. LL1]